MPATASIILSPDAVRHAYERAASRLPTVTDGTLYLAAVGAAPRATRPAGPARRAAPEPAGFRPGRGRDDRAIPGHEGVDVVNLATEYFDALDELAYVREEPPPDPSPEVFYVYWHEEIAELAERVRDLQTEIAHRVMPFPCP